MKWLMMVALLVVAGCSAEVPSAPEARATMPSPAPGARSVLPSPAPKARETMPSPAPKAREAMPSPGPTATRAACKGTSVLLGEGFPEVRGTGQGAELWGLLFAPAPPLARGEEIKIVWRMTGEGPLRVRATLPDGTPAELAWGPEQHDGSSWHKPGQEWGTGFVFPKRGCWKVELTRTRGSGYVWLPVR